MSALRCVLCVMRLRVVSSQTARLVVRSNVGEAKTAYPPVAHATSIDQQKKKLRASSFALPEEAQGINQQERKRRITTAV